MNDFKNRKTPEERKALLYAITEGKIKAESLLEEIVPFLEDYFICRIELNGSVLKINLYNGQTFELKISEI